jgi:glycerol uptake facilitator-like aquaporin
MAILCPRLTKNCDPEDYILRTFLIEFVCTFGFVNFVMMIKYNANTNCGDEVNIKNLLAEDDKSFFILRSLSFRVV